MEPAPIALFVYNRPDHTRLALQALSKARSAEQSVLYVFADGPRIGADESECRRIREVRKLVRSEQWCGKVKVIEHCKNKGLRSSVVDGVTEVVSRHARIIVLEDDIVVSEGFLEFANEALEMYEDDQEVMHINGCMYNADFESDEETAFLKVLSCQGWATWRRAWRFYNDDVLDHLAYFQTDAKRRRQFDVDGNAYFMEQLRRNVDGRQNTWAVRWYASWLRAGGYSLFPLNSLVYNIGFDGSGLHCGQESQTYMNAPVPSVVVKRIPIAEDQQLRGRVGEFWAEYQKSIKGGGRVRATAKRIFDRATGAAFAVGGKISRRILGRLHPDLGPLLASEGRIAWRNLASYKKCVNVGHHVNLTDPHHLQYCTIGEFSYLSHNCDVSYTEIGKFCSIGPSFRCGWGIHPIDGVSTSPSFYSEQPSNDVVFGSDSKIEERKKITIGNDVFIGMNVTVLDGVTIGDGAVIGAGCVVSKDVPPYAIAVGCPMIILRYRFDEATRKRLLGVRWWDWPEERLPLVAKHFADVEQFIAACEKEEVT